MRNNVTRLSTIIDKLDAYQRRRLAYANLTQKNIPPNNMANDQLKVIIMFLRGDKKGFPCSNLSKPKLKQTLAKVLQSYNGQLPPVPREPTLLERQVVSEYKTEQKRIEQEQKAREAAKAEARVDNTDSGTNLPVTDLLPLLQS